MGESHVKMVGKKYQDGNRKVYVVTGVSRGTDVMVSFKEVGSERVKIKPLKWFREHMYSLTLG